MQEYHATKQSEGLLEITSRQEERWVTFEMAVYTGTKVHKLKLVGALEARRVEVSLPRSTWNGISNGHTRERLHIMAW